MMWRDVIYLLTATKTKNGYGEEVEGDPVRREVFANKKSVRQSEFYQALAVGMKPELVFEIQAIEYKGELKADFEGTVYHIIRTFSNNGETLELILSRFPMGG
ncbi:phage head closure protein [Paenibacillus sedimenti]|uniref:Phage head closure protein n=1 Tax=Paenibacillus sedimenti TaxID=2770274 RepID=A0A926KQ67_9BACL|nr:phage head closure protein [Paenibacillus sedimenti]MBD0381288.1 phage head closure protein [Paenibacillus sedimenti]